MSDIDGSTCSQIKSLPSPIIKVISFAEKGQEILDRLNEKGIRCVTFIAMQNDLNTMQVEALIGDVDMLLIVIGSDDDASTATVAAKFASRNGALVLFVVARSLSQNNIILYSLDGFTAMRSNYINALAIAPNKLPTQASGAVASSQSDLFNSYLNLLHTAIVDITYPVTAVDMVTLDFDTLKTLLIDERIVRMATATTSGDDWVKSALKQCLSQLASHTQAVKSAGVLLINITAASNLLSFEMFFEVESNLVIFGVESSLMNVNASLTVIVTAVDDNTMKDELRLTLYLTSRNP